MPKTLLANPILSEENKKIDFKIQCIFNVLSVVFNGTLGGYFGYYAFANPDSNNEVT